MIFPACQEQSIDLVRRVRWRVRVRIESRRPATGTSRRKRAVFLCLVAAVCVGCGSQPARGASQPATPAQAAQIHPASQSRPAMSRAGTASSPTAPTARTLDRCWGHTRGRTSSPSALCAPSHVTASGGAAHIVTYLDPPYDDRWVTGGTSSGPCLAQMFGCYEIRFRVPAASGVIMRDHAPGRAQQLALWR
jgi:hypothetical protein